MLDIGQSDDIPLASIGYVYPALAHFVNGLLVRIGMPDYLLSGWPL